MLKEVQNGLWILPLRSPTLAPATHTNLVVFGHSELSVIDPAPLHEDERNRMLASLLQLKNQGQRFRRILLTHHHRDHFGAAMWLAERLHLPIEAHPQTAALLPQVSFQDFIYDQSQLTPEHEGPHHWQALYTPGHASGHLAFYQPERGLLVAGDLLASVGTIIIDPPDGHMGTYYASLKRLLSLPLHLAIPSHGEPIFQPHALITHYLNHRDQRESKVLAALSEAPQTLAELTPKAYPEVAAAILPLAQRSALAHLEKLVEEGLAHTDREDFVQQAGSRFWRSSKEA